MSHVLTVLLPSTELRNAYAISYVFLTRAGVAQQGLSACLVLRGVYAGLRATQFFLHRALSRGPLLNINTIVQNVAHMSLRTQKKDLQQLSKSKRDLSVIRTIYRNLSSIFFRSLTRCWPIFWRQKLLAEGRHQQKQNHVFSGQTTLVYRKHEKYKKQGANDFQLTHEHQKNTHARKKYKPQGSQNTGESLGMPTEWLASTYVKCMKLRVVENTQESPGIPKPLQNVSKGPGGDPHVTTPPPTCYLYKSFPWGILSIRT